jgi:hypothetical protein
MLTSAPLTASAVLCRRSRRQSWALLQSRAPSSRRAFRPSTCRRSTWATCARCPPPSALSEERFLRTPLSLGRPPAPTLPGRPAAVTPLRRALAVAPHPARPARRADTRAPGGRRGSGRRRRARRPFSRGSRSRPSARPSTRRERAPLAPPCPHAPRRRPNDPAGSCAALTPRARPGAGLRVRDQVDHARRAGAAPPRARVGPARARVVLGSGRGAERRAARADGDAGRGGRGGRGGHGEHVQRTLSPRQGPIRSLPAPPPPHRP